MRGDIRTRREILAVARAKRDERLRDYRMAGNQAKGKPLRQRGDDNGRFQHGESLADATPGAVAKRKIGACGKLIGQTCEPALGTKCVGIGIIARVAMHDPLRHEHGRAGRKIVPGDLARLH